MQQDHSEVTGFGKIDDIEKVLDRIEKEIRVRFTNVQTETARKVVSRCVRKVQWADQSTQMGHDMFTEERINLNQKISDLNIELTQTRTQFEQQNRELTEIKNKFTITVQKMGKNK